MPSFHPSTGAIAVAALAAVIGVAYASPAAARSDREIAQLLQRFSDDKEASHALDEVVGIGPPAVAQLRGLALEKQDVVKRGWAIAALAMIGGDEAARTLQEIGADPTEDPLVREWAAAGQINLAKDLDGLLLLRSTTQGRPALDRPFRRKLEGFINAIDERDTDALIALSARDWQLQQALGPKIVEAPPSMLVKTLWTSPDNNIRRTTASYLATQATSDQGKEVARALLTAIRFDAAAEAVPWTGGALFIPTMTWPDGQARQFADELMRWMLWADGQRKPNEVRQVNNNLSSIHFSRQAGYGRNFGSDPRRWVAAWRKVYGERATRALIISSGRAPKDYGL
jgi:hypothetical protein